MKKILICDDSPVDQVNLKNALNNSRYNLLTADNGSQAVSMAKQELPDIIFMDIIMPEMDGFEACRTLQNDPDTKHIPIVFVSSKSQRVYKVWALMQGARDMLVKPFKQHEVISVLASLQGV